MKVVVIGDGLLGRSIADVLPVTLLSHQDIELWSRDSIERVLPGDFDVAINTAAIHRLAETEVYAAQTRGVNEEGARNVARLLPTVFLSTDYVWNDDGPHDESLPGETPRSVYGQTKLAGELATLEHGGIVVRVAGVFGHHPCRKGPTFPETILSSHDPIRLPTDQVFSPTYAPDAASRIVQLALRLAGGGPTFVDGVLPERLPPKPTEARLLWERPTGIYHAANDGSTSWAAFGQEIADLARHDRHISGYEARDPIRPRNSSLVSTRLPPLRHWKQALIEWESKR